MKKYCLVLLVCFISLCCLLSCGLEALYYIDYIPNSDMRNTTNATIKLPSSSYEGYSTYFTHFIIFYRIYISDVLETTLIASTSTNNVINPSLNTALTNDFTYLYLFTDKTSTAVSTSNLENIFLSRNYFLLELENENMTTVLSDESLGKTLEFFFSTIPGTPPTLSLNDEKQYILRRNRDLIRPLPDRNFLNHPDLYNTANITSDINADVATNANEDVRYTYVSMYIAAKGKNFELPPQDIYSQPTFIGVFSLADR